MKPESAERLRKKAETAPFIERGYIYYIDDREQFCRVDTTTTHMQYYASDIWDDEGCSIGYYAEGYPEDIEADIYKQFFTAKEEKQPVFKEKINATFAMHGVTTFHTDPEMKKQFEYEIKQIANKIDIKQAEINVLSGRRDVLFSEIRLIEVHENRKLTESEE